MARFGSAIPPGNRSLHDFIMREAATCSRMAPKGLERRPSEPMLRALRNMAEGREPFHNIRGMAASGGAERTRVALIRRGWMTPDFALTDLGRAAVARFCK